MRDVLQYPDKGWNWNYIISTKTNYVFMYMSIVKIQRWWKKLNIIKRLDQLSDDISLSLLDDDFRFDCQHE